MSADRAGSQARGRIAVAGALVVAGLLGACTPVAPSPILVAAPAPTTGTVEVGVEPRAVTIAPLPCDRRGRVQVSLTQTGPEPAYVDALITAPTGLDLSRTAFVSWLPAADPDQTVSGALVVTARPGTRPGRHPVEVTAAGRRAVVDVTVERTPRIGPDDNLARFRQAFASSTHPNVTLCGGVDGNADSEQWGDSGTHDRTQGVFPDTYGVVLDRALPVGRVEIQTLDSARYPAARMGIRDVDVQARVDGAWITVASFRGNTVGRLVARFPAVRADRIQVVTLASNDGGYSRIVELEVYRR